MVLSEGILRHLRLIFGTGYHRPAGLLLGCQLPTLDENYRSRVVFKSFTVLDFIPAKFVTGYPCERHYILFYIHGPAILHYF